MIRPEPVVLLLGLGLLFPIQSGLDATRGEPPDLIETLPPTRLLPALAMGHRETAADLLEIRATTFLFKNLDGKRALSQEYRDHLWALYDAILELDPNNADAGARGGMLLGTVGGRHEYAVAILKHALGEPYQLGDREYPARAGVDPRHPRRWRLFHEQAATYFLMHANRTFGEERRDNMRKAGELWQAAHAAGGPEFYGAVGRKIATRKVTRTELLRHEQQIWDYRRRTGDKATRALATERLNEIQATFTQQELQKQVDMFVKRGRPIRSLADLKIEYPPDPLGGGFELRGTRVIAPRAEARRLQRLLRYRWRKAREKEPDRLPTVEELLQGRPLPDYLRVHLSPKRLVVEAAP